MPWPSTRSTVKTSLQKVGTVQTACKFTHRPHTPTGRALPLYASRIYMLAASRQCNLSKKPSHPNPPIQTSRKDKQAAASLRKQRAGMACYLALLPTGSGIAAGSQLPELVARPGEQLVLPGLLGTPAASIQQHTGSQGFTLFLTSRKDSLYVRKPPPPGSHEEVTVRLQRGVGVRISGGDELLFSALSATESPEESEVSFLVTEVAQVRFPQHPMRRCPPTPTCTSLAVLYIGRRQLVGGGGCKHACPSYTHCRAVVQQRLLISATHPSFSPDGKLTEPGPGLACTADLRMAPPTPPTRMWRRRSPPLLQVQAAPLRPQVCGGPSRGLP